MNRPKIILLVKLKSPLNLEQVTTIINSRIEEFRALDGLQQKYHLQGPATGEYAGLYLWKSTEDFESFRDSE